MLNFNVDPYYDDFDPNNHYHRILFRPGRAVQARELTQSQTILQDQISKFANHIFKQNTPVTGGQVTVNTNAIYLKLNTTYNDNDITASDFLNQVVTDSSGTIFAKVIATEEATSTDAPTLIVTYLSGKQFSGGDIIYSADTASVAQLNASNFTGNSTTASISEGVFYIVNGYSYSDTQNEDGTYSRYSIGNFVSVQPHTIIVQKYGNTPTKRIGLSISEYISDYVTDPNLLDPAVGATNYQAPGADRYTITLTLDTRDITPGSDSNFIELTRITDGIVQRLVDGTVYGVINDYFAKRTYDTNGDFVVSDFKIVPRSNTVTGNANSTYQLQIGKGVAYNKGYRVENVLDTIVETTRARTTANINNNFTTVDYGNYFYVNNLNGVFDTTAVVAVDFHCINANSSLVTTNTTTYNSTKAGSGYIRALSFYSASASANTQTYVYKAYVSDLQSSVLSGTVSSATTSTITFADTTGKFNGTVANTYFNCTLTVDSGPGAGYTGKIIGYNHSTKTATMATPILVPLTTASTFSIRFDTKNFNMMVAPTATGFNRSASSGIDPALGKTPNNVSNGDTVLWDGSSPELLFDLGYDYVYNLSDTSYSSFKMSRSVSISSNTAQFNLGSVDLTFNGTASATQSSTEAQANWIVTVIDPQSSGLTAGQVFNLTGVNASTRAGAIALDPTKKIATITSAVAGGGFTATITAKVNVTNGGTTGLALKSKNLTTANTTNVNLSGTNVGGVRVDLTNAQVYIPFANLVTPGSKQSLYICDVKRIRKIIDSGTPVTTPTDGMLTNSAYDVTNNFLFDNGQTDSYYGHASIRLKPGSPQPKGALLVLLDYYLHAGGDGYFSVNSYLGAGDGGVSTKPEDYAQIGSYTSKAGTNYSLRDVIDFRLSVVNAQSTFAFRYSGSITGTGGILLPQDISNFLTDYRYYLGRKDILVLTKDNNFNIISGKAADNPTFPTQPDGSLMLAKITLDPYTAYLPGDLTTRAMPNLSFEKVQHRRWAMADISDLQTRVNNLEYYTSLSLLEKQAADLQVPDVNGLNRFKNGILVDNFTSFAVADTGNADYAAKINKRQTWLTAPDWQYNAALFPKDAFTAYGNLSTAAQTALNYRYHSTTGGASSIITLPYTTANLAVQKLASNTVSLNPFAVAISEGVLNMNPPMDMWVSTVKDPDILITDPNMSIYQAGTTLNQLSATDWQAVTGTTYSVTKQEGNRVTTSTYQSQSQQVVTGNYDKVSSLNGTYITDVTLQPYIRSQSVIVRASGMKVNTPVSVYFDDVKVNQYMVRPNVVVVSGVPSTYGKGGFEAGDIIGYMSGSTFVPTGRVTSVSTISTTSTTKVQMLYVTNDQNTTTYSSSNILQNAVFDASGNYVSNTTFGTYSSASTSQISLSGTVQGTPTGGSSSALPGGATYYSGVTSIQLGPNASSTNNYYNGATITIRSTNQVSQTTRGKIGQQWVWGGFDEGMWLEDVIGNITVWVNYPQTYQAVISSYNGSTKVATLATPVNITKGSNQTQFDAPSVKSDITSTYTLNGTTFLMTQATTSDVMTTLSTDAQGNFTGIFQIPGGIFKTGDRLLRVDNRTTDGDSGSATTFAQGIFTASSLATRSQSLNFGATIQAAAKSTVFTSVNQQNNVLINQTTFTVDPVAQTFIIDKNTYPSGAFIKSIKVFFRSKPTQTYGSPPVKLFITDTLNGYPDGQPLDGSLVTKTCQEITTSLTPHYLNASTYTEFVFDAPVYIRSGNLYSFILQTTSPDYVIWIAAQNSIAVSSSVKALPTDPEPTSITKIGGTPYVGALFESQNGITWTADQTKQMMFTIENCVFSTIVSPAVEFIVPKKIPARKPIETSIEYVSQQSTMNTFTSIPNFDGNFFNRDIRADAFNVTVTDFAPTSTTLSYTYRPTLYSDYSADTQKDVSPGKYGTTMEDHLYMDDGKGARVINANTANSFILTATISTSDKYVSPVLSDDGTSLYIVKNIINDLSLANTDITVTSGNTINQTANYSSTPPAVTISAPTGPGGTQAYATANIVYNPATTGYYVDKINITSGGSGYIETPTITIAANTGGNSATAIVSGETSAKGGNGLARYITKPVVLTPDNVSGDLRVYYTAYKPVGSQVNVYYKILNGNDTGQLNDQNWTLMTNIGEKPSSFSLARNDLREYVAAPGVFGVANNQVSYTSTDGSTYTTFNQFAIKLVLQTSDTARTPIVHDLRVLALPSGA
jgi:hypothetical protein